MRKRVEAEDLLIGLHKVAPPRIDGGGLEEYVDVVFRAAAVFKALPQLTALDADGSDSKAEAIALYKAASNPTNREEIRQRIKDLQKTELASHWVAVDNWLRFRLPREALADVLPDTTKRLLRFWLSYHTSPGRLESNTDWYAIRHWACELFGHPTFSPQTFERLIDWLHAGCDKPDALATETSEAIDLLQRAVEHKRLQGKPGSTYTLELGKQAEPTDPPRDQGGAGQSAAGGEPDTPPAPTDDEEFVFAPSGNSYFIKGFGESGHLSKYKGLDVIARLVRTPGKLVSMLELVGADHRTKADRRSTQKVLDADAKSEIKEQLGELQADLERARKENNTVEADLAEKELEELKKQLLQATGLGGKDRDLNNLSNRLRPTIHAWLKTVCAALRKANPPMPLLAQHFELTISSENGNAFVYRPGPAGPSWKTDQK
jgi:hypothetical protein